MTTQKVTRSAMGLESFKWYFPKYHWHCWNIQHELMYTAMPLKWQKLHIVREPLLKQLETWKKKSKTIYRWVSTIRSVKWCWCRTLSCQQHFPPPHTLSGIMLKSPPHCIHPHSHHQYHLISTRANTMTNSSTAFTKVSGPCTSHVLCMVVVNNDIWFHFNFQMRYCTLVNHQTQ